MKTKEKTYFIDWKCALLKKQESPEEPGLANFWLGRKRDYPNLVSLISIFLNSLPFFVIYISRY